MIICLSFLSVRLTARLSIRLTDDMILDVLRGQCQTCGHYPLAVGEDRLGNIHFNGFHKRMVKPETHHLDVDVEWRIGSAHAFSARGPGFNPIPNPDSIFRKLSSPFFQTMDLKTIKLCDVMFQPITKKKKKKPHYFFVLCLSICLFVFHLTVCPSHCMSVLYYVCLSNLSISSFVSKT